MGQVFEHPPLGLVAFIATHARGMVRLQISRLTPAEQAQVRDALATYGSNATLALPQSSLPPLRASIAPVLTVVRPALQLQQSVAMAGVRPQNSKRRAVSAAPGARGPKSKRRATGSTTSKSKRPANKAAARATSATGATGAIGVTGATGTSTTASSIVRPNISFTLPSNWAKMPIEKDAKVCISELDTTSQEYITVQGLFEYRNPKFDILRIKRVQNPEKQLAFNMKCQILTHTRTSGANVRTSVFHGASAEVIEKICVQGFDRTFSRRAAYGSGTYFARDACYSSRTDYARPDKNGIRRLLVCSIILGESCRGTHDMDRPPIRTHGRRYDSMVNSIADPSLFVLSAGTDDHAYPNYIVEFKLKR